MGWLDELESEANRLGGRVEELERELNKAQAQCHSYRLFHYQAEQENIQLRQELEEALKNALFWEKRSKAWRRAATRYRGLANDQIPG